MIIIYCLVGFGIIFHAMTKTEKILLNMGVNIDELEESIYG